MKLLNLTNRYYIAIALALLMVSSTFLAYRVLYVVDNEISDQMRIEKMEIEDQLLSQKKLQNTHFTFGDQITIEPIQKFTTFKVKLKDITEYDPYIKRKVPFRLLVYEQIIDGNAYRIWIRRRLTETYDLANGVPLTLLLVAIDIIACFYFLNRWFSQKIWQPFYRALHALKFFDLKKGGQLSFQRSNVEEFNTLNAELAKLTDKVTRDYRNLREFTENMSHETQTPLAIIRSKLELLLQSENLSHEHVEHIRSTLDSVNRLSKMNKGLIMLTRIDNDQYPDERELHIGPLIRQQLQDLEIFISSRELKVEARISDEPSIRMNKHLAEIMLTNLLSNAIKYSSDEGKLIIELTNDHLLVANSGEPLLIPDQDIFERFKKGNKPDSVGLGLAIVKRICDHSGFDIRYEYRSQMHTFIVSFGKEYQQNLVQETIASKKIA